MSDDFATWFRARLEAQKADCDYNAGMSVDAGWNPDRVREHIEAYLHILDDWQKELDQRAAIYHRPDAELHAQRMHPDYEYATTEGQRKAWDHSDEPPWGDNGPDYTWERNTDAGRDGWERFEHTEESYWRRLLPEGKRGRKELAPPRHLLLLAQPFAHHPGYQEGWRP